MFAQTIYTISACAFAMIGEGNVNTGVGVI
jgi:hypothetical protein